MADAEQRCHAMTGRRRVIILYAFVVVQALFLPGCGSSGDDAAEPVTDAQRTANASLETEAFKIKGRTFMLELALDNESREQGLSDRESIDEDGGMLFAFSFPMQRQFVMRRCLVPIDLIFIDRKGYIDSLHRMEVIEPIGGPQWLNPSGGYTSVGRVQFAIELKSGMIDELGLERGDKLDLPWESLQSRAR